MDTTNLMLKTRVSEALETVSLIILLYAIFLAFLGLILHNSEVIIQTCIMFVVYAIFEYINYDITYVSSRGIKCGKFKNISWKDIYRIEKKERVVLVYTKEVEKPYKIVLSKYEDSQEIAKAYKYMLSKIKTPDKVKEVNVFKEEK